MTANDVYALINAAASDALGKTAISVKDTSTLVSLGETVLSSSTDTDTFYQKLVDRIGRTYIKFRAYVADNKDDIIRDALDFGIVLQKVQVKNIASAKTNESWATDEENLVVPVDDTEIMQTLFSKLGTWSIDTKVIYDEQLRSAFVNAVNMAAFVDMIFQDMYNAMEFQIEQCIKMTRATLMAKVIKSGVATQKRNLLTEYNTEFGLEGASALTAAEALHDASFLKFASREINKVAKRFSRMTQLFNASGADRFTPADSMVIEVLSDYASATASYLESDTYNKEMIALPRYREIDCWQASGTSYAFADASKIHIKLDGVAQAVQQSGVLAVIRDRDAAGVMIDRIRTKSMYFPSGERTAYYHKADWGSFVDISENCVLFYVA